VLHGGGNTSVKVQVDGRTALFVKGSGANLAMVCERDYAGLALAPLQALLGEPAPDNAAMFAALSQHMLDPRAPRPSIETLMHAALPAPHVIHTHAAPVLALSNTRNAAVHLRAALGGDIAVAPYRHSGAALARACIDTLQQAAPGTTGLVLAHHGIVTWGGSGQEALDRTLAMCARADRYLDDRGAARPATGPAAPTPDQATLRAIATLRRAACRAAQRPLIATARDGGSIGRFARRADVAAITAHGPSTPGHAIFTKRIPMIGRDVAAFAARYAAHLDGATAVDCAPRVALDASFGMLALGVTKRHADIAAEIFIHDAAIIARASAIDTYDTIDAVHMRLAEIEYAGFEERLARESPLAGQVFLLDRACERAEAIAALLRRGAAVIGIDARDDVTGLFAEAAYIGLPATVPDAPATAIMAFGGIDHIDAAGASTTAFQPFLEFRHE
jgi:rhamnose utilization protein RhaD (predicted bifunctional aldolase and dehydrogenase)